MKKIHPSSVRVLGPYSPAVRFENIMFTSGQLGLDPESLELVSDDLGAQLGQIFENTKVLLESEGVSVHDIIKATIFMIDLKDFQYVNEKYGAFLEGHHPARTTVQISALPKSAKIEIEWIIAC